jgi:hypothetical protein
VASAIAGIIGPRRDAWQYDAGTTVSEAFDKDMFVGHYGIVQATLGAPLRRF